VPKAPPNLTLAEARRIWLSAQGLDQAEPFGGGPEATPKTVAHLGYVQIDTINVIERAHHHILFTRIPDYRRAHLAAAQSAEKSIFEYWTHALSYVPTADYRYFMPEMKRHRAEPVRWYADADPADLRRLAAQIRREGPISIRDVDNDDDVLVEKNHPWASRKPSKRVLQLGFYNGLFAISARQGMVKTYELADRHFGWTRPPTPATPRQVAAYMLDRSLRAQGLISAASVMYPKLRFSPEIAGLVDRRVKARRLREVRIEGVPEPHWVAPETLERGLGEAEPLTRILSPFDPLIIQRRRTAAFFGYDHVFEAYVPKAKRQFGYFTLPVLCGDEVVAALDLKTDRAAGTVLIQAWHWVGRGEAGRHRQSIEEELERFTRFQLGD
jgi:uncharacterized protein YcaQ